MFLFYPLPKRGGRSIIIDIIIYVVFMIFSLSLTGEIRDGYFTA